MECFIQGLVYFLVAGILWYLFQTTHIWKLGTQTDSKKKAVISSLVFAAVATAIFMVLNLLLF